MKNIYKLILLLSIIFISDININAQVYSPPVYTNYSGYNTAIGFRFGGATSGITGKQFISPSTNLEGILSFSPASFLITGLYEVNSNINGDPGFNFVYGIGGHVGFFGDDGRYYVYPERRYNNVSVLGVDFILGLDYKFRNAPINIGIDIKPFVDFYSGTGLFMDAAISVRFAF